MELNRDEVTSLAAMLPSAHHTHVGAVAQWVVMLSFTVPSCSAYTDQSAWRALAMEVFGPDRRLPEQHLNPSARPDSPSAFLHSTTHIRPSSPDPARNARSASPTFADL
jgi:hypothetical protein